jgi:hypothetical protein
MLGIGMMNGFALVAQSDLSKAFGVTASFGSFRPSIAITLQGDSFDFEALATLSKFRCTIAFSYATEKREKRASARKPPKDLFDLGSLVRKLNCWPVRISSE